MSTEALLSVEGLSKSYGGVRAVRGVSFTLSPGEILALIGPNGAGKSTCFNMLNGQTAPDAGRVRVLGQDTTGLKPREVWRLGVGRTFQITATFPTMTVRENIQVALSSHDRKLFNLVASMPSYAREEAERLLDLVGMGGFSMRACGELAYGDLKGELDSLDETKTEFGWTIGAGMEVGLTPRWSAKVEYLYMDLGSRSFSITGTDNGLQSSVLRLGVNYHF